MNKKTNKNGIKEEKGLRDSKSPLLIPKGAIYYREKSWEGNILTGGNAEREIFCPSQLITWFCSQGLLALVVSTSIIHMWVELHRPHGNDRELCYYSEVFKTRAMKL